MTTYRVANNRHHLGSKNILTKCDGVFRTLCLHHYILYK